jgi:hypothetical protein
MLLDLGSGPVYTKKIYQRSIFEVILGQVIGVYEGEGTYGQAFL